MPTKSLPFDPTRPDVRLFGDVEKDMADSFWNQIQKSLDKSENVDKPLLVCLTTNGGDADTGRKIALDIRMCQEHCKRDLYFLGKATVMSAGITIMSAFPRERRFLTKGTALLIHERQMTKDIGIKKEPISQVRIRALNLLAQCDNAIDLERQDFADLVKGSRLSLQDIVEKGGQDWYMMAPEALKLGLIEKIV